MDLFYYVKLFFAVFWLSLTHPFTEDLGVLNRYYILKIVVAIIIIRVLQFPHRIILLCFITFLYALYLFVLVCRDDDE